MELYALAQQRQMLACMGIDLWVAKDVSDLQTVENLLYRDHVVAVDQVSSIESVVASVAPPVVEHHIVAIAKDGVQKPPVEQLQKVAVETNHTAVEAQPVVELELAPAITVAPFELQAIVLPQCIVVLEATALTTEQQQLWANIQAAQAGQSYNLKWPFALAQFQDGHGVTAYIQGFLAALQQEQTLIALGALPVLLGEKVLQQPSLQEMLDQPLLKRQLWQQMQGLES